MKKIIFIFFVSFLLLKVNAQNQLTGRVVDEFSKPLTGASVYLPDLNKGTITNQDGKYIINGIPNGKFTIQFSYVGYNTQTASVLISKKEQTQDALLSVAIIASQEVVVTGGYVSSQHENAVKIDVLKREDIVMSGSPNFMESLTKVPGVDMISKGPGVSKPVIRGLSMNDVLVMNNGVRIENYQFSENHPLGIGENDIERVEIIKGTASLLYGSDAIGGVVNFIKEKPAAVGKIVGDYQMQWHSNTMGVQNSAGLKGASDHFFWGIRLDHKTHADYLQGGGGYVPNSRFNEMSLHANSGYTGNLGTFRIYYDCFSQDLGMTVPAVIPIIAERGRNNRKWYQDLQHQMISSQNKLYLGNFKWEINAAYQNALRRLQTTLEVPFVEMSLNTLTYDSKLYFPSGKKSEFILGLQGMAQNNKNLNNRASQFLPDALVNNIGILGLAKVVVSNTTTLQGGLRFDVYNTETDAVGTEGTSSYIAPLVRNYSNLNGSFGITYRPEERLMLRMNIAKGYRVPNLSELTSSGMHGNRFEQGNADLSPENSIQTDLSLHYHGELLSFDLAGYYNHLTNYIHISPSADTTASGLTIYRFSQTNARLYGGEAGIHFHPRSLPWMHFEANFSSVIGKQENGDYLSFIPAHKMRYEIRADRQKMAFLLKPTIKVSALTAFSQKHPSPYETETGGYTIVNLNLGAGVLVFKQRLEIGLAINNLFDTKYYDHLSTLKGLYYNPGRNINVSLKLPFEIG